MDYSDESRHAIFLGRDLLTALGLELDFSKIFTGGGDMPHSEQQSAIKLMPQCRKVSAVSGQTSRLPWCMSKYWLDGSRPDSSTEIHPLYHLRSTSEG